MGERLDLVDLGPWNEIDLDAWPFPHFRPFELRHRYDNRVYVVQDFMEKVEALRARVGFGMEVTSYYRSPEYDASIGGAGPHRTGRAIDIQIAGANAHALLTRALAMGFTGIGVKQNGPWSGRFLHLDDLDTGKRPRIWSY